MLEQFERESMKDKRHHEARDNEVCSLLLLRMRTEHIQPRKIYHLRDSFNICSVVNVTLLHQIHLHFKA
jgi:hypothetical protein